MMGRFSFDDALNAAIDALAHGEPLDAILARHPRHAGELRPLLETAALARRHAIATPPPMSPRLADNFSIVRAAAQRAQMAGQPRPEPQSQPAPWWQRRLTFASLSLPAGAFALLAFAGVSGAAAASLAATGTIDLPAVVDHINPAHWGDGASPQHPSPAGGGAQATSLPGQATPGSENQPTLITIDGTISGVHGDVFTLTTADGEYKVNIDATTEVNGEIADGATATVTGDLTAEKNLHAGAIDVTAGATPTSPGNPGDKTPGPPAEHTPGPPGDHTPPGPSAGASGQADANNDTNGGGTSKKP